ncbi:two component system response regulator [soil metagenome]
MSEMNEAVNKPAPLIRIVLADDHALVLEGLCSMLGNEADLEVVATATDGAELLEALWQHKPDVAVVDLQMPNVDGLTCLQRIRAEGLDVRVLVLSAFGDGESIQSAMEQRADGFALKTEPPQQTIAAIRQVYFGHMVFPNSARRWVLRQREEADIIEELSAREWEVLAVVGQGLSNPQIAETLHLSESTIKFHLQNIFQKLSVTNRTEAARYFYQHQSKSPSFSNSKD